MCQYCELVSQTYTTGAEESTHIIRQVLYLQVPGDKSLAHAPGFSIELQSELLAYTTCIWF